VQSFKSGHRSDARHRPQRSSSEQNYPKNHNDMSQASKVGALEGAVRVANLKLLLTKVGGDLTLLSAAVQVKLSRLQQMLDAQEVVTSELATHIEETLALDQGWLDRKHEEGDISTKTVDILLGKDTSDFEKDIRNSEQKGLDIMKTSTGSTPTSAAPRPLRTPRKSPEKPVDEFVEVRKANLTILTQARGAKSKLARALGVSESIISFLFNGKKDFSYRFARDFEKTLNLPAKWLDTPHSSQDVPQKAWDILGNASPNSPQFLSSHQGSLELPNLKLNMASAPTELERGKSPLAQAGSETPGGRPKKNQPQATVARGGPRTHRVSRTPLSPKSSMDLRLDTSAAPSELVRAPQQAETLPELETIAAPTATAPAEIPASRSKTHAPSVHKSTAHPPADKQAAAPVSAPTPVPPEPTAVTEASPVAAAPLPSDESINTKIKSRPDTLVLSPITEALIKTLTLKAQDGSFTDKDAYRLLGDIAGL
jgi:transcriptional regulator with XRE-family HTH domain